MTRLATSICALMLLAAVFTPASASAQPAAATSLSANPDRAMNFSWAWTPSATWYYLWVTDSSGKPRHQKWYTASQLNCGAGQTSVCQIDIPLYLLPGNGTWWVQTYSDAGYGPWTAAQTFAVPGPLFAVVTEAGALSRGNAVSAITVGVGRYQVVFGRDVTACVFNANLGTTSDGTAAAGTATTARLAGESKGVWINTYDAAGTLTNRSFHLSVVCH